MAADDDNPYLVYKAAHDTTLNKALLAKKKWQWVVVGLFVALLGSVYGNAYQLGQYKIERFIHTIDDHGREVATPLRRVEEIADNDTAKQAALRDYLLRNIKDFRDRMMDQQFLLNNLNRVGLQMVGQAKGKWYTAISQEKPFDRIKRERVEVKYRGFPLLIPGTNYYELQWAETVSNPGGYPIRNEVWRGRFQVVELEKERKAGNVFGFAIPDWEMDRMESKEAAQ